MNKIVFLLLPVALFYGCKAEIKVDKEYVIEKFRENADKIKWLEYRIQRIDTFAQGGNVWNNTGLAIIEKDDKDEVFGFSFYGKRDDIPEEYIYDAGNGFEISNENKTYKTHPGGYGFLGSPGGQMIQSNIFNLDSIYKKVSLNEKEKSYVLRYEFENDTVYHVTDIVKIVELNKDNFFPIKITRTSYMLGNKAVYQSIVSDLRINENTTQSIKKIKSKVSEFTLVSPQTFQPNKLLGEKIPELVLPDLFDENKIISIGKDKPALIDFWEVWCGPCIKSLPQVEDLNKKYSSELNVIGIVSEDKENAIKLVKGKGITFPVVIGNKELKDILSVNSFPRYFLVGSDGVMQKEYFGFSDKIEEDIKVILGR